MIKIFNNTERGSGRWSTNLWSNNLFRPMIYILLMLGLVGTTISKTYGQSPINYVEYYVDQDPGIGVASSVPVTSGTTINNASFTVNVSSLSLGMHILGARAKTVSGVWSMGHYWFIFKPYIAINTATLSNISKVEYYVDKDPGIGNGTSVTIGSGVSDLSNLNFSFNATTLSTGAHIVGVRALDANGQWSETNYWMFYNPFNNINATTSSNVNYVEYYIDKDPGVGKGISVSVTAGQDIVNGTINATITSLASGPHFVGVRAKDAAGNWSATNYFMFVKPFTNITASSTSNISQVEYYLDYDPGNGNGLPVSITPGTDLADKAINVDITGLNPGAHTVVVRSKDAAGKWSMVNTWAFTVPGTPVTLTTLVSTTTVCGGSSINVGYQFSGAITLKTGNKYIAQLSDANGSFLSPTEIGSLATTSATTGSFICNLPSYLTQSGSYKIRVVTTNQSVVGSDNGSGITIYPLPVVPTIISPAADTTVCQGNTLNLNATSTSYGYYQWYYNGNPISGATSYSYTVNNIIASTAGAYKVKVSSYYSNACTVFTPTVNIAVNTNVPAIPTVSPSGSIGVCLGTSRALTSSTATSYQWLKDGVAIPGATTASYSASTAGTFTVKTGNGTGCFAASSNSTVITLGLAAVKPSITLSGSASICSGNNLMLTSSAFSGNQWLKNNAVISGETGTTYYATTAGYYQVLVGGSGCSVVSDSVQISVNNTVTPSVSIATSANNVPPGTTITITATAVNGGAIPVYTFRVNGNTVQSGALATYTSNSLVNNDVVSCTLLSNAICTSTTTATSNSVTILTSAPVFVTGKFATPTGALIPGATVRLAGGNTDSCLTDVNGKYSLTLYPKANYSITGYKNNDFVKVNGVNVLDLVKIQQHILGSTLLGNPYKMIAADVNGDGAINILDVVLVKRFILGMDTSFAGKRLWAFIDSSYTFPVPTNPFSYNGFRNYTNITSSLNNQSFVGVRLGDVTFDWSPISGFSKPAINAKTVKLYYDTVYTGGSDVVRIKVKASNFKQLSGIQFGLHFNESVFEFVGIENSAFLKFDVNDHQSKSGDISFLWFNNEGGNTSLQDGYVLFDIILKKKAGFDEEKLTMNDHLIDAVAYDFNSEPCSVYINNGLLLNKYTSVEESVKESISVYPNPLTDNALQITINANKASKVQVQLSDSYGRVIFARDERVVKGLNKVAVNTAEMTLLQAGIYYVKITGLSEQFVKQLVVNKRR